MSKTRIILIVFLPTLVTTLILLHLYFMLELKSGLHNRLEEMQKTVKSYSLNMAINAHDISRQVDVIADLLTDEETGDVLDVLEKSMTELSFVEGFAIAYDPDFLSSVKSGEFPEFDLRKRFGKWVKTNSPDMFAPLIYRDKEGHVGYSDDSSDYYETKDWFLGPKMIPGGQWINPFVLHTTGQRVSAYGHPFFYKDRFAGVVSCFVRIEALIDPGRMNRRHGGNAIQARFFVVGHSGRVIYHTDYVQWPKFSLYSMADERGATEIFKDIDHMIARTSGQVKLATLKAGGETGRNSQSWYVFSTPRSQTHWTVVGAVEQDAVIHAIRLSLVWFAVGIIVAISAICSVVSVLLFHSYTPIKEVTRVAQLVAGGDLTNKVDPKFIRRGDDIGQFINTFNGMIDSLKNNMARAVAATSSRLVMENEFHIAQEMQESFLPSERSIKCPERGFEIAATLIPAKFVAGDFFNYWNVTDSVEAVLIADVSGKGVAAAMVMIEAQTLLREIADKQMSPGEVVTRVNAQFTAGKTAVDQMFITLFFAYYDSTTGRLRYANAGHNPPFILRRNGQLEEFPLAENVVVGILPDLEYVTNETWLEPGESLFLFTDGATDTVSPQGKQYGTAMFAQLLRDANDPNPDTLLENVIDGLEHYRGTQQEGRLPQADDTTMVILRRMDNS